MRPVSISNKNCQIISHGGQVLLMSTSPNARQREAYPNHYAARPLGIGAPSFQLGDYRRANGCVRRMAFSSYQTAYCPREWPRVTQQMQIVDKEQTSGIYPRPCLKDLRCLVRPFKLPYRSKTTTLRMKPYHRRLHNRKSHAQASRPAASTRRSTVPARNLSKQAPPRQQTHTPLPLLYSPAIRSCTYRSSLHSSCYINNG